MQISLLNGQTLSRDAKRNEYENIGTYFQKHYTFVFMVFKLSQQTIYIIDIFTQYHTFFYD